MRGGVALCCRFIVHCAPTLPCSSSCLPHAFPLLSCSRVCNWKLCGVASELPNLELAMRTTQTLGKRAALLMLCVMQLAQTASEGVYVRSGLAYVLPPTRACHRAGAAAAQVCLQGGAGTGEGRRRRNTVLTVRIKILEDVVRRVKDPALSYNRKRETVSELEGLLARMRTHAGSNNAGALSDKDPPAAEADLHEHLALTPRYRCREPEASVPILRDAWQPGKDAQIEQTVARMREARVVAVLRGNNAQRITARGLELAACGCRCMEVTLDSPEALHVLRQLRSQLPPTVLLGAATVMSEAQASDAIAAGAMFITSPVAVPGLHPLCRASGILAVPAGLSPTEIYASISTGARAVKVFPASALSPAGLQSLLQLGPFRDTFIMAAGGIEPSDVHAWLSAGAGIIALGSRLVGADSQLASDPPGIQERPASAGGRDFAGLVRSREEAWEVYPCPNLHPCSHLKLWRCLSPAWFSLCLSTVQGPLQDCEIDWQDRGRAAACALFASMNNLSQEEEAGQGEP